MLAPAATAPVCAQAAWLPETAGRVGRETANLARPVTPSDTAILKQ